MQNLRDGIEQEHPLRLQGDELRVVLESTADGILIVDENARVVLSNGRFAELWRIPEDLLTTRDDDKLLAFVLEQLVDPESFLQKVRQLYRSSKEDIDLLQFRDGRVFERFSAPLLHLGPVAGRVWSFRDITLQKNTETALRESEQRFRSLYNHTPVMLHSVSSDWKLTDVSDYWLERLGYERKDVIGRSPKDFMTEKSCRWAEETWLPQLVRFGRVRDVPYQFVTSSGEVLDTLLSAIAQYDTEGRFKKSFAVIVDVSDLKHAEEEKRQLEAQIQHGQKLESLGILAGGIAHDFNNLLVGIQGNADLALLEQPVDTPGRELIEEIVSAARRAAGLCNELLAYSGKGHFVVQTVDLSEVVRDMAHLLDASIPKRVSVQNDFPDDLPAVQVDVTQVRQVVMNMITNAAEALSGRAGTVRVSTGVLDCDERFLAGTIVGKGLAGGKYVYLEISDSGEGMDADRLEKIFDPFFTSKATGRGLGLAATLGIVRGHKGTIDVQSSPGAGSTFRVYFPASPHGARPMDPGTPSSAGWRGSGLVLVVDDEPAVLKVAERTLRFVGFDVLGAANGTDAVRLFRENPDVRVVLLDLTMPGLSGVETLAALREIDSGIRVVLTSGYHAQATVDRFASDSAPTAFIQKPYGSDALLLAIREALETADRDGR